MPVICSRRIRFTESMRTCITRKPGTIRLITNPTASKSAGMQTARIHESPKSSRIAITMPPTIMIGAVTIIVQDIITSIWTCCTSFVVRVMSDGAPNWRPRGSRTSRPGGRSRPRRSRP